MNNPVEHLSVVVEYDQAAKERVLVSMGEKGEAPIFSDTASLVNWLEEDNMA